jgi:hypothetical protein
MAENYYSGVRWGSGSATPAIAWSFATLPGDLVSFVGSITQLSYKAAVQSAFAAWESVANIDFVEVADSFGSDIRVGWSMIDGPYNTLGVAASMFSAGQMIKAEIAFDVAEAWQPSSGEGETVNFYATALHEIGHAIGLDHSSEPSSIMYPQQLNVATLSDADIAVVQSIYGSAEGDDVASEAPGTDVFRFYNSATGVHFYTASVDERDDVLAANLGFFYEGNVFDVPIADDADITVYRFYNSETRAHFYTASAEERDNVMADNHSFHYEGPAYKAYADVGGDGSHQALHRFYNDQTGTHFYTASFAEKAAIEESLPQFRYEGVAYYVDVA